MMNPGASTMQVMSVVANLGTRPRAGRRTRFFAVLSVALFLLVPIVSSQGIPTESPTPTVTTPTTPTTPDTSHEFDVSITLFTVQSPLVLDNQNLIALRVRNLGQSPTNIEYQIEVENANDDFTLVDDAAELVQGGREIQVNALWNGRANNQEDGVAYDGTSTIRATARPGDAIDPFPADNERLQQRALNVHDHTLAVTNPDPDDFMDRDGRYDAVVRVTNLGNADDEVTISIQNPTAGWTVDASDSTLALPIADPEQAFLVRMTPSPAALANTGGSVDVLVRSANAPHIVHSIVVLSPLVRPVGDLLAALVPASRQLAPGSTGGFDVVVNNEQNQADEVTLEIVPLSSHNGINIAALPAGPLQVPSQGQATFGVTLSVAATALAGDYDFRTDVASTAPEGPEATPASPFRLTVLEAPGGHFEFDASVPNAVLPGGDTPIAFRLHNDGNGIDQFRVVATQMPATWQFLGPASSEVGPFQNRVVPYQLRVPFDHVEGTEILKFRLESANHPSISDLLLHSVHVPHRVKALLESELTIRPIEPRSTAAFTILLTNRGNHADTFDIASVVDAAKTNPAANQWNISVTPTNATLAPGQNRNVTVTVESPNGLARTDGLWVALTATPRGAGAETGTLTLRALPAFPDLKVEILDTVPATLYLGAPANLTVRVTNDGTLASGKTTTLVATLRTTSNDRVIARPSVTVPALDWRPGHNSVNVTVPLPTNASQIQAAIQVDETQRIAERDETNNGADTALTFQTFDVRVLLPSDFAAQAGQAISLEAARAIRVENRGTRGETLAITVRSTPGWATRNVTLPELLAGQPQSVSMNFAIPAHPSAEEVTLTVRAERTTAPFLAREALLKIRVPDTAPPRVVEFGPNASVASAGAPIRFEARLEDPMGILQARLYLIQPDGAVDTTTMTRASGDTYSVEKRLSITGTYQAYVWAKDGSAAGNTKDTSATPRPLIVRPARAFELAQPANATFVRPGSPLFIDVKGVSTLTRVDAMLDAEPLTLTPAVPLVFATDGWTEGVHMLHIEAYEPFGSIAQSDFLITVDATAPKITGLSMSPSKPTPGQNVVLVARVADDAGVVRVVARLVRAAGAAEDIAMTASGDAFRATIPFTADLVAVGLVAEDAAGNRGYDERPLDQIEGLEQEGKHKTPMPQVLLVLVAALATMAIRKTRGRAR